MVKYDGTGAYFLDRLDDGIWRLELYPDVAWVHDPFTRPSLEREAARVIWRVRPMRIDLPDLGEDFAARPIGDRDTYTPTARHGTLDVRPGVYLLTRSRTAARSWQPDSIVDGRRLGAFAAPPSSGAPTAVLHSPPAELSSGEPFTVRVEVVSKNPVDSAVVFARRLGTWGRMPRLTMKSVGAFGFEAEVPAETVREGLLEYVVSVYEGDAVRTFPGSQVGDPYEWDFSGQERWRVPVVAPDAPLLLFDGRRDMDHALYPHPWSYVSFRTDLVPGSQPQRLALKAEVEDFTPSPHHFAVRTFLPETQRTRLNEAPATGVLRVRARAAGRPTDRVEISLVGRDGSAWGTVIELTGAWREIVIPVADLRPVPLALLPRPYPQFLPYLMEKKPGGTGPLIADLDGLQFSVSAALFEEADAEGAHGFEIESVTLDHAEGP